MIASILACAAPQAFAQAGSSPSSPLAINGTEHLAWDQAVARAGWIVGFQFIAYVDDQAFPAADAKCSPIFCTQCGCTSSLPRMTNGMHRIEMAARDFLGNESGRSAPIYVVLGSSTTQSVQRTSIARTAQTAREPMTVLASTLDRPSALAPAPDGSVFVAEGSGRIVVWKAGRVDPAAFIDDVADKGVGAGPIGLGLDPDFAANGRVFIAYTSAAGDRTLVNRIVRYRFVNGTLGEPAVIFEDPVRDTTAQPARIEFGPDGKLYALFPANGQASAISRARFVGTLLRLNVDGTTPVDNPGMTPVYVDPPLTAFGWQPFSAVLRRSERATAMAFFGGDWVEIVAGQPSVDGRPLEQPYAIVSDIAVGPDGALYFCALDATGRGRDVLARIPLSRQE